MLLGIYYAQPALHQRIMQLKALIIYGQNKIDFFRCVSRSDLRTIDHKRISLEDLNIILNQLVKNKLLLPNFDCDPKVIHEISQLALSEDNPYAKTNLSILENERLIQYASTSYLKEPSIRAVHIAIHQNNFKFFDDQKIKDFMHCKNVVYNISKVFYQHSLDLAWVKTRVPIIQALLCCSKLRCFFVPVKALPPDLKNWIDFFQQTERRVLYLLAKIPKNLQDCPTPAIIYNQNNTVSQLIVNKNGTIQILQPQAFEEKIFNDFIARNLKINNDLGMLTEATDIVRFPSRNFLEQPIRSVDDIVTEIPKKVFLSSEDPVLNWFISKGYGKADFKDVVKSNHYLQSKFLQIEICMAKITKVIDQSEQEFYTQETLGTLAFLKGDLVIAERYFIKAINLFGRIYDKTEWFKGNFHVIFYGLTCICQGKIQKTVTIITTIQKINNDSTIANLLQAFLCLQQNAQAEAKINLEHINKTIKNNNMSVLVGLFDLIKFLLEQNKELINQKTIKGQFLENMKNLNFFTAQLYAECLLSINPDDSEAQLFFSNNYFGNFRFLKLFKVKQQWEYAIDQLRQVVLKKPQQGYYLDGTHDKRLVWFLNPKYAVVNVAEQKLRKNGTWTDGKPIALKRLYNLDPSLEYLTEHDKKVIQGLRRKENGWYHEENFYWDQKNTINALIGHPLVLHAENPLIHLELVKGELELQIENINNGYLLSLKHHYTAPGVILEPETTNRYRVIDFSEDAVLMSKIIPKQGMRVPLEAKDRIIDIVHNTKLGIVVHSDVKEDNIPTVHGDPSCWIQLLPMREGLKINLMVRPFGEQGPYCLVAHGQNKIISTVLIDNVEIKQKAIRDFAQERQNANTLINSCPTLSKIDSPMYEWNLDDLENCLQVLTELEEYKKEHPLHLEWPRGQVLKVQKTISSKNLSLSIKAKHSYFEYDGSVILDNDQVFELKNLLDLLDHGYGRFIKLGEGAFLALTESFKKQLEELKTISDHNKVYHLSSRILKELAEQAKQAQVDSAWEAHIQKLKSMERHSPIIPSTLQANLRNYQEEGFCYLSRLAHWGIGACLADDMGLGKTIQAIVLLLEQAKYGPCLVVAPTTVCFIWLEELAKFAPTLNVYTLNNSSTRKGVIDSLNKMDLLICSYTLLHQVADLLSMKTWQVVVLDEAQAIKNSDTKRWKNATQLISKCRIALTGTPIENHLGELWSIFQFLNPGLLGSLASFQQRFAIPIERNHDPIAKRVLKNLICPYILRRMKSEVLQELPAKTEQTIFIEPTSEEMAFYEAVRIKALEKIQQLNTDQNLINKRFSILAEISKLRQACCHSSLIDDSIQLESSKIKVFLEILKNLIENKHKLLVFSQYVRYLAKIKEVLTTEAIAYQYLDGATPTKERQTIVESFQAGVGEVFLISLKAGGMGLNLTVADYVIILDPWWNPAVEDQASDRAHRIGQQRPVTVYRLVMKNSIEEKIIKLHHDKKNLASDLLSGSDVSGKITEEELIQLIS